MEKSDILERISLNNQRGEELIKFIQNEIPALKAVGTQKHYQQMEKDILERNAELKKELVYWQNKVIEFEALNNIPQYSLPSAIVKSVAEENVEKSVSPPEDNEKTDLTQEKTDLTQDKPVKNETQSTDKKVKKEKGKPLKEDKPGEDKPVDVGRLDLRIGRILTAKKHPDAESLYVEEIDVGEGKPRTVVSGLVKYVPLEEMQNRLVVVLCNLKPAKMRGITSEAMVMCASTPEKVEILVPPTESIPGDRVICKDYVGEPDSVLPPKKKIFEQVAPDLKTNDSCVATYKGLPLEVANKGQIKASTLINVQIK